MNGYIIIEDDCAPDALESFEKQLRRITGFCTQDFKQNGEKIEFGYTYKSYKLERFPDDPFWHLSKH